jgi:hypothetical protein
MARNTVNAASRRAFFSETPRRHANSSIFATSFQASPGSGLAADRPATSDSGRRGGPPRPSAATRAAPSDMPKTLRNTFVNCSCSVVGSKPSSRNKSMAAASLTPIHVQTRNADTASADNPSGRINSASQLELLNTARVNPPLTTNPGARKLTCTAKRGHPTSRTAQLAGHQPCVHPPKGRTLQACIKPSRFQFCRIRSGTRPLPLPKLQSRLLQIIQSAAEMTNHTPMHMRVNLQLTQP